METETLKMEGIGMAKGTADGIQILPIKKIKLGENSRLSVSDEELDGLMASIKEVGLLQPIGVVREGSNYEICYGNRRFMACSKLGLSKIPAVVHDNKRAFDTELKNLTENIQRRNLGLAEVGRFIALLKKDGLSSAEAAVRLGVSKGYVENCAKAFGAVPEKFRDDLEIRTGNDKTTHKAIGKIPITTATAILSAQKSYGLNATQVNKLFSAAKSDDRFEPKSIGKYAAAMGRGENDPIAAVEPMTYIRCQFFLSKKHRDDLVRDYVEDGPFRSFNGLLIAILKGEKSLKIKINQA